MYRKSPSQLRGVHTIFKFHCAGFGHRKSLLDATIRLTFGSLLFLKLLKEGFEVPKSRMHFLRFQNISLACSFFKPVKNFE
jgi:hypothetical protein